MAQVDPFLVQICSDSKQHVGEHVGSQSSTQAGSWRSMSVEEPETLILYIEKEQYRSQMYSVATLLEHDLENHHIDNE